MAVGSNLGAVVREKEGSVATIPGNEGRITQARGGMRVFSENFWQLEGWTPRNEATDRGSVKASQSCQTSMAGGM